MTENAKLAAALIETAQKTLDPDNFFRHGEWAQNRQISDLRWSCVKLCEALAALLPDEPFASDKS